MRDRINNALKAAMKNGEKQRVSTIRLINAAVKDRDIEARTSGKPVDDSQLLALLQKMIKSRQESMALYEKGGRPELAQTEADEITVIQEFLPEPMSDRDVDAAVDEAIASTNATSIKDMGKVVGQLKDKYAGRMDFAKVSGAVKARLSSPQ